MCNHPVAKSKFHVTHDIFGALTDPTRSAILSLLALQAMTPNALCEHFKSSRQAVSKHIRILVECGLVKQEDHFRRLDTVLKKPKKNKIMSTNTETRVTNDVANKKLVIVREFDAPLEQVWKPGLKKSSWIYGARQNHGGPRQNQWTLKKVVYGFIRW